MAKGTNTTHYLFLVSGLLLLTAACKKHTGRDGDENPSSTVNVYILGTIGDSVVYWKNGIPHSVTGQSKVAYKPGSPSLFASGNDVYIAGFRLNMAPSLQPTGKTGRSLN